MGLDCALYPPSHFSTSDYRRTFLRAALRRQNFPISLPVAGHPGALREVRAPPQRPAAPVRRMRETGTETAAHCARPHGRSRAGDAAPPRRPGAAVLGLDRAREPAGVVAGGGDALRRGHVAVRADGAARAGRRLSMLQRWWPLIEPLAYWSAAFGALESHWDHATRPIRLVKAPPDLAKVESLLAYFGARGVPYRFVALTQHPCLLTESHRKHELLNISAYYLHTAVRATPPPNLFVLDYERLLADAEGAAQELADTARAARARPAEGPRRGNRPESGGDREPRWRSTWRARPCARAVQRDSALSLHRGRRGGGGARRRPAPPPPPAWRLGTRAQSLRRRRRPPPPCRARVDPVAADAALGARRARRAAVEREPGRRPGRSAWAAGEMRRVARLLRLVLPLVGCAGHLRRTASFRRRCALGRARCVSGEGGDCRRRRGRFGARRRRSETERAVKRERRRGEAAWRARSPRAAPARFAARTSAPPPRALGAVRGLARVKKKVKKSASERRVLRLPGGLGRPCRARSSPSWRACEGAAGRPRDFRGPAGLGRCAARRSACSAPTAPASRR